MEVISRDMTLRTQGIVEYRTVEVLLFSFLPVSTLVSESLVSFSVRAALAHHSPCMISVWNEVINT